MFSLLTGASISDRSQSETANLGEDRIAIRRSLTDSLAVSSMLLLQPQQVSFNFELCYFFLPTFMLLIHTSTRDNDHNHDVRNENEPSSISSMWLGLERSKSSRKKVRKWRQTRDEREIITEIYFFWPKSWFWTLSKVGWLADVGWERIKRVEKVK